MDKVTFGIETRAAAAFANPTWETLELRRTIARTCEEVAALLLSPPVFEKVNQSLEAATQEAAAERPDRYEVGEHLGAAAHTLKDAGALVGADTGVVQALRRAVELLGPAGLATIAPAL
jgi:hypothetical protein